MSTPTPNPFANDRVNHASDFRPDWDVASLNDRLTENLLAGIGQLKGRQKPDPEQKIRALLSPPGYGKSHLFGRLAHRLQGEALVVFVPQIEDVLRPLPHFLWHLVESLFDKAPGGSSPLERMLARLCHGAFRAYIDKLPKEMYDKSAQLWERWDSEPLVALEAVSVVKEFPPFLALARSVADAFPKLRADIVRALVLGWSPAGALARKWLRGEELPEGEARLLGLEAESPLPIEVFLTLATLLQHQVPMVLCCDQLEAVTQDREHGPKHLSNVLMGLLAAVPNLQIIVSCLEDAWEDFIGHARAHSSFRSRTSKSELELLNTDQAVELLRRRVQDWAGARPDLGPTWPIQEEAIRRYVEKKQVGPRGLMTLCASAYERWMEEKSSPWITQIPYRTDQLDLTKLFLALWEQRVEAVRADPKQAPAEIQEERLFRAVREALVLYREADYAVQGFRLNNVQDNALQAPRNTPRPACLLDVSGKTGNWSVIVAVTKFSTGHAAPHYLKAIETAFESAKGKLVGLVLVHPPAELPWGKGPTRKRFEKLRDGRQLRTFPLVNRHETHSRLLALLSLLDDARGQLLQLGDQTISEAGCLALMKETGVLRNLDLYREIFENWPSLVPAAAPVPAASAAVSKPVAAAPVSAPARVSISASVPVAAPAAPGPAKPAPAAVAVATPPTPGNGAPRPATAPAPAPAAPVAEAPPPPAADTGANRPWANARLQELVSKLKIFGLPVEPFQPNGVEVGPAFARLKVKPLGKTSVNQVRNKAKDLMIHLNLQSIPAIGQQPGCIAVDVQLPARQTLALGSIAVAAGNDAGLPVFPVGQDVSGKTYWLNLADPADCHLLIAGTTGSGKSEFLKVILAGLARQLSPQQLQLVLIDPKRVTFNFPGASPYFHAPVVHTAEEVLPLIEWCLDETERRYEILQKRGKEDVSQLAGAEALPRVVAVFDEFADLMDDKDTKKELERLLKRIAAKARAAGVHLILATQRPEAGVVTPLLRSNLPGRVALHVASEADSKLILKEPDAVFLLGRGDLLWRQGGALQRLQSPWVSRDELVKWLRIH